jgi:hypothetical protein
MKRGLGVAAVIAGVFVATGAGAAERVGGGPHGNTTLWFGTGLAVGESESGAAFRFGVDQLLTGRLRLELVGSYLDRGLESEAWNGYAGLRLDLAGTGERAVPYFAVGAGFYRARFGLVTSDPSGASETCGAPGFADCSYAGMPAFYRQRMARHAGTRWRDDRTFTDPMAVVGGGVRWDLTPRLFVVPDARALLVTGDGDTITVGVFTLNFGYRF